MGDKEPFRRFEQWLEGNRILLHPSLEFRNDAITGNSLFTSQALPPDTQVITVPSDQVLTPRFCRDSILQFLTLMRWYVFQGTSLNAGNHASIDKLEQGSNFISAKNWVIFYLFLNQLMMPYSDLYDPLGSGSSNTGNSARNLESENSKSNLNLNSNSRTSTTDQTSYSSQHEPTPAITLFKFSPYISMLPKSFSTPLHFKPKEFLLLRGTPLYHSTIERENKAREDSKKIVLWFCQALDSIEAEATDKRRGSVQEDIKIKEPLERRKEDISDLTVQEVELLGRLNDACLLQWRMKSQSLWKRNEENIADESIEDFGDNLLRDWTRAETSYGSRAFPPSLIGIKDEAEEENRGQDSSPSLVGPILIPGLDTFNHERGKKVTWFYEETSSHSSIHQTTPRTEAKSGSATPFGKISLTLHDSTPENSQVFNNYGAKSNEEFLGSYGFVNGNHDDDYLTLVLGGSSSSSSSKRCSQKHFWRFSRDEAPDSLLREMRERLLLVAKDSGEEMEVDEDENEEVEELKLKGEVLETLEILLLEKRKLFKAAERDNQDLISRNRLDHASNRRRDEIDKIEGKEETEIREEVLGMVSIYRNGQRLILDKAIDWTRKQMERIEESLDAMEEEGEDGVEENEGQV